MPNPNLAQTVERVESGVIHIRVEVDNKQIASGSGFIHRGHLVTNNHNLGIIISASAIYPNLLIILRSNVPGMKITYNEVRLSYEEFVGSLEDGSDESNFDFAIFRIPRLLTQNRYDFHLGSPEEWRMGDEVALLGYPLNHQNLVCHSGIISSRYEKNGVKYIQLDASVNPSNSGGPLIDPRTGEVIGIVSRRHDGFTDLFQDIERFFRRQIAINSSYPLNDIHPRRHERDLSLNQSRNILSLLEQLKRSANVGIGYAFSIEYIASSHIFN